MNQSQLIELFRSFTKKELRSLELWIQSPFINQRADVKKLFEYLVTQYPIKDSSKLEYSTAFSYVFPNEPYDHKRLGYTMSFLNKVLKKFLSYRESIDSTLVQQISLLRALRKKGVARSFQIEYEITLKRLEKQPWRNQDYHYWKYQLYYEYYEWTNHQSRTNPQGFQELSDEMSIFFIANVLKQACTALSLESLSKQKYHQPLLKDVLRNAKNDQYVSFPAIMIYYHAYQALSKKDKSAFEKFRDLVRQFQASFPKEELKDLYLHAINYCIKQYNAGNIVYLKELFNVYQEGLEREVFIENGLLSKFTYKNILMTALGLKAFSWAESFLINYKGQLDTQNKEGFYNYCLALLYYQKLDYDRAMILLQSAEPEDFFHQLEARKLLLKIYFELGEVEALDSLLDSFKIFIYRQRAMGYHQQNYLNLIRFTKKLLNLKSYDSKQREKLRLNIQSVASIAERTWLLEQL